MAELLLPPTSQAATNAVRRLVALRTTNPAKETAAAKYGAFIYDSLDIEPGALTASRLIDSSGMHGSIVGHVIKSFRQNGLIAVTNTAARHGRTGVPAMYYTATPELADFAADYNVLFAEHVSALCQPALAPRELGRRAIRSLAAARGVSYPPTAQFDTIMSAVVEQTDMHPQSAIYRSLSTCALGMGILRRAENDLSATVRDWSGSPTC